MYMTSLEDKIALITGAGSGIGSAIAVVLAARGADIIVNDINVESAKKVAEQTRLLGRRTLTTTSDVTASDEVEKMVKKAVQEFGKIDILVNNVGEFGPRLTILEIEEEEWDRKIRINLKGTYLCTHFVATHMVKRKNGKIINIASISGKRGAAGSSHYAAAKFGVIGFTQAVAKELAPYGIHVNAVCPGSIDTPMLRRSMTRAAISKGKIMENEKRERIESIPLGRIGTPEDVAKVVAFLASSESDYMTGQALNVTGGMWVH